MVVVVKLKSLALLLALPLLGGCSYASVFSTEALVGSTLGAVGGTAAGYGIGESIGKKTENMALGAGIGTGLGMLAGGLLHERNVREAQTREVLIRDARMVGENQREIDALRERMTESSSWGRGEVKSWNERYWGDSDGVPYEGRYIGE